MTADEALAQYDRTVAWNRRRGIKTMEKAGYSPADIVSTLAEFDATTARERAETVVWIEECRADFDGMYARQQALVQERKT